MGLRLLARLRSLIEREPKPPVLRHRVWWPATQLTAAAASGALWPQRHSHPRGGQRGTRGLMSLLPSGLFSWKRCGAPIQSLKHRT